jgi:hypothetical protein
MTLGKSEGLEIAWFTVGFLLKLSSLLDRLRNLNCIDYLCRKK